MGRSDRITGLRVLVLAGAGLVLAVVAASGWAAQGAGGEARDGPTGTPPPGRVVSMNLCTDQLAMQLAAPGQLVSVSSMARDARVSAMAAAARRWPVNYGRAEEIYLQRPDLVLAGRYTAPDTVAMLRRLGVRVAVFDQARALSDVRANIMRMGRLLARSQAAADLLAAFDARLARLRPPDGAQRPRAVLYYANGYTLGDATLAGQILHAAGFENAARTDPEDGGGHGYGVGGWLPLERLAMLDPDLVITATRYPGASRAEAILDHPVVRAFRRRGRVAVHSGRDWVCGTPHVLDAIAALAGARRSLTAGGGDAGDAG